MLEGAIWVCTFGGRLFTVVVSWLTIDVLWKPPMTHIRHKVLGKRDIGHIWDRRSNRTYNFVYSVIPILKIVVDERLVNQRGLWDGSSEVSCENWAWNGTVIRMSGFGVVLLCFWTWWGAWVQGNVYYGSWMTCCRERRKSGVRCSGAQLICCREHIRWAKLFFGRLDVSGLLDCACGKNSDSLF